MPASTGAVGMAIRVARPVITWSRRRFTRDQVLFVQVDRVDLRLNEQDLGQGRFSLKLINLSRKSWELDHIELDYWTLNSAGLPEQSAHLTARGTADKKDISFGSFGVRLDSAGVRAALRALEPASNPLCSPRANTEGRGVAVFRRRGRSRRIEFQFQRCCETHVVGSLAESRISGG